ncbi:MAG TPA: hypothetical protein VEO94_03160 [Candidatus Dormibacteraeota bacterium]|nr:hypothetical protein [Candidatus Dormibacteraeota bacterium]
MAASRPPAGRRRAAIAAAALLLAGGLTACRSRNAADPVMTLLAKTLRHGDRLLLARALDPEGTRIAAVVVPAAGKPELRFYESKTPGVYGLMHVTQQGDGFRNLTLEDVDADGRDEYVVTWEGGHLEIVEVIARGQDGSYTSIFQNAGRQVEKRYTPAGQLEFWITSRTYDEKPGQAPGYETTVYGWKDGKYLEIPRKQ